MKLILIPWKGSLTAKQRLAGVSSRRQRAGLARCMLRDVAGAVEELRPAPRVALLGGGPWAAGFARRRGWEFLAERRPRSESASVDRALARLARQGVSSVLRLPADVPLVEAPDLARLLGLWLPQPGALLVPSRDGTGTNALLRSPPDAFPSCFGPGSRLLHGRAARRAKVPLQVVCNRRLELDLDTPADLLEFCRRGGDGHTRRFLRTHRIEEKLNDAAS